MEGNVFPVIYVCVFVYYISMLVYTKLELPVYYSFCSYYSVIIIPLTSLLILLVFLLFLTMFQKCQKCMIQDHCLKD